MHIRSFLAWERVSGPIARLTTSEKYSRTRKARGRRLCFSLSLDPFHSRHKNTTDVFKRRVCVDRCRKYLDDGLLLSMKRVKKKPSV